VVPFGTIVIITSYISLLYLNCILVSLDNCRGGEAIGYFDNSVNTSNNTAITIVWQLIILNYWVSLIVSLRFTQIHPLLLGARDWYWLTNGHCICQRLWPHIPSSFLSPSASTCNWGRIRTYVSTRLSFLMDQLMQRMVQVNIHRWTKRAALPCWKRSPIRWGIDWHFQRTIESFRTVNGSAIQNWQQGAGNSCSP
jgi:hypothetical protein